MAVGIGSGSIPAFSYKFPQAPTNTVRGPGLWAEPDTARTRTIKDPRVFGQSPYSMSQTGAPKAFNGDVTVTAMPNEVARMGQERLGMDWRPQGASSSNNPWGTMGEPTQASSLATRNGFAQNPWGLLGQGA